MLRHGVLALLLLPFTTLPAAAYDTVSCRSFDGKATIDFDVEFGENSTRGRILRVESRAGNDVLSTVPGEKVGADSIFANVASNRIELVVVDTNMRVAPMALDVVLMAEYDIDTGALIKSVVAGVADLPRVGIVAVTCTGW